eukprot:605017-Lingulodinium_polyedra.AAC.1
MQHERAFILESNLVAFLGCPLKTLGLAPITIQDVENNSVTGVIFRMEDLPPQLPWIKVTVDSRTEIVRDSHVLAANEQLRGNHAECFFNHSAQQVFGKRPTSLRTGSNGLGKSLLFNE